jgi:hypothetical protein
MYSCWGGVGLRVVQGPAMTSLRNKRRGDAGEFYRRTRLGAMGWSVWGDTRRDFSGAGKTGFWGLIGVEIWGSMHTGEIPLLRRPKICRRLGE